MGVWGAKAWECDGAGDWFGGLHRETGLRNKVVEVLTAGVDNTGHEAVRAAAWVVVQMGRVYVWPIEHLQDDLRLAVACLHDVWQKRLGPLCDFDESVKAEIDAEIATLQGRVRP